MFRPQVFELLAFKLSDAFVGGRKIFRHGAAKRGDGASHGAANSVVNVTCGSKASWLLPLHLRLRLRDAKEVGRKLFAAHVVEDRLILFQMFAPMDVLGDEAAVQTLVTGVLKRCVVELRGDACLFCGVGKHHVPMSNVSADNEAFAVLVELVEGVGDFLPSRLNGEIRLPESDDFFAWIAVLNDQVACVAGEPVVLDGSLASASELDHFDGADKMVLNGHFAVIKRAFPGLVILSAGREAGVEGSRVALAHEACGPRGILRLRATRSAQDDKRDALSVALGMTEA